MPRGRPPQPVVLSRSELLAELIAERFTPIPPHRVLPADPPRTYERREDRRNPGDEFRFATAYAALLGDTAAIVAERRDVLETGMAHVPDRPVPAWRLRELVATLCEHYGTAIRVGDASGVSASLVGRIRSGTGSFAVSQQIAAALLATAEAIEAAA